MNLLTPADAGYTHVSNTILKELFLSMLKDTWKNITKSCHRTIYLKVHSKYTFKPLFLNTQGLLKPATFTAFNTPILFHLFYKELALISFGHPNLARYMQGNDTGNTLPLLGRALKYHILKASPDKQTPYPPFHTESQVRRKKEKKEKEQKEKALQDKKKTQNNWHSNRNKWRQLPAIERVCQKIAVMLYSNFTVSLKA